MSPENSYTIVLTHDVDHIALRDYSIFSRYIVAFAKNAVIKNFSKLLKKHIPVKIYMKSFLWTLAVPLVKIGIIKDPLEFSLQRILRIEEEYGVRSTFYFVPFKNNPGFDEKNQPASVHRAAAYDITRYKELLNSLESRGWEIGIHGLNAHIGSNEAEKELAVFQSLLPSKNKWGIRMHWLYHPPQLWENLRTAGYYYDATFGSNEDIGFKENRYHPFQRDNVWELPLTIQDGALLAGWHRNLPQSLAWEEIKKVLDIAKQHRAVVTVLWHNASFGPPRYWEPLYRKIIEEGKKDGARFLTALQAIETFEMEESKRKTNG